MTKPIIDKDGTQKWYKDGELHRDNGPAVNFPNGTQWWYRDGNVHREDGPAVIYADGTIEWWLEGLKYTFNHYCDTLNLTNEDILLLKIQYG